MTRDWRRLILHSLRHYARPHLAVALGVMTATAVIAGALVVGDSVRASLRQMSLDRLGGVDYALTARRFFREQLAESLEVGGGDIMVAPAIVMPGGLTYVPQGSSRTAGDAAPKLRAGGVMVYGVDERLWSLLTRTAPIGTAGGDPARSTPADNAAVPAAVGGAGIAVPTGNDVVLNRRTAEQLQAAVGAEVSLVLEIPPSIPRDALLGDRDQTVTELVLRVSAIADDVDTLGRFGLHPGQQLPLAAYVPLATLQQQLGLSAIAATRRNPVARPARVNALFFARRDRPAAAIDRSADEFAAALSQRLQSALQLTDLGLKLSPSPDAGYVALESEQMILEAAIGSAGEATAQTLGARTSPVLVYLLNRLGTPTPAPSSGASQPDSPPADSPQPEDAADRPEADAAASEPAGQRRAPKPQGYSMYSVAAGIEFDAAPPFGPFEFVAGAAPSAGAPTAGDDAAPAGDASPPGEAPPSGRATARSSGGHSAVAAVLGADADAPTAATGAIPVVVNDWLADDLRGVGGDGAMIAVGETFPVRHHVVGDRGELPEEELTFVVSGIVRLTGAAADRGLTPQVEGVTDVESYSDWREPFPLDHDAITARDDDYWKRHRATPKLFLRLADAQRLWRSRYGELTSLRLAPPAGETLAAFSDRFAAGLLSRLTPSATGLVVQPVKRQGVEAANGTTDFTGLFIGFSLFLIASALLLAGLLFRLGVEQRVGELGLLAAVGLTPAQVRRLFALEGGCVAIAGALLGMPAAVGYAALMIYGLKTWWNRAIGTQFLVLEVRPASLAIGFVGAVAAACGAILWSLRQTRGISARDLLHGATEPVAAARGDVPGRLRARRLAGAALGGAALLLAASLAGLIPASEAFGGLSWRVVAFFVLGLSLLTGGLASLAAALGGELSLPVRGSGAGALARLGLRNATRHRRRSLLTTSLIAAAVFLIVAVAAGKRNPQQEAPQRDSGNGGFTLVATASQPVLYDLNTPAGRQRLGLPLAERSPQFHAAPFRMRPGDDASCLNLYQAQLPTILGIPDDVLDEFDRNGRFRFAGSRSPHPWKLLQEVRSDGRIPVIGDLNTLMFSLKKGIGDVLPAPSSALAESTRTEAELVVAGMLDGSIFQGVLVMSERNFQLLFPRLVGFRYFLIETDPQEIDAVAAFLETGLEDAGFDGESVATRLSDFLAVQNTYLSTFQTLGGLGLLLGTIGLATVMLRNVLERRREFALLRAIGLRDAQVLRLVLLENAALLGWGLLVGTFAALLAMWPHLAGSGADVPWGELTWLLLAVTVVGLLSPLAAARAAIGSGILASLKSE